MSGGFDSYIESFPAVFREFGAISGIWRGRLVWTVLVKESDMQDVLRKKARFFLAMTAGALLLTSGGDTFAANGSVTYSYDTLGRLASASFDTGVIIMYSYDPNGNRTQQVINVNTSTLTWSASASPCGANCWGGALW